MWSLPKKLFTLSVLLSLSSCGYTLSHGIKKQFVNKRGIFVPVFSNVTEQIGAERPFTNALIRELLNHGEIILSSREKDGLELLGTITQLDVGPSSETLPGYNGLNPYRRIPTQMGITVGIALTLSDPNTKQTLWSNSFSAFRRVNAPTDRTFNYQAPSSLAPTTQSLVEAEFEVLADDIVRDIYDDMVELF